MKKFKSELVLSPIFYEEDIVGFVRNIVINNENGIVVAICTDKECKFIIPNDQLFYFMDRFFVKDRDPIFESKDIIQVKKILSEGLNLNGQMVINKDSGEVIGRLIDYSVNMKFGTVSQILVRKRKFWFFKEERLIDVNHIFQIGPDTILVDDSQVVMEKEKEEVKIGKKKADSVAESA
jgi:sporulation protein YlmC with PRC-barrel domain